MTCAAIAEGRVLGVLADGGAEVPASFALGVAATSRRRRRSVAGRDRAGRSATTWTSETMQRVASKSASSRRGASSSVPDRERRLLAAADQLLLPHPFEGDEDRVSDLLADGPSGRRGAGSSQRGSGSGQSARWTLAAFGRRRGRTSQSSSAVCGMIGASRRVRSSCSRARTNCAARRSGPSGASA